MIKDSRFIMGGRVGLSCYANHMLARLRRVTDASINSASRPKIFFPPRTDFFDSMGASVTNIFED